MGEKIFIVDGPFPPTEQQLAEAAGLGIGQVVCGIPASLAAAGVEEFGAYEYPDPPEPEPPGPPAEVATHRVHKQMLMTPWTTGAFGAPDRNLYDAVILAIEALPASPYPLNKLAMVEFMKAPNLVRLGSTTGAVQALLGMTDEQRDTLMVAAALLP